MILLNMNLRQIIYFLLDVESAVNDNGEVVYCSSYFAIITQ